MTKATKIFNNLELKALLDSDLEINYEAFYKDDLINMDKISRKENKELKEKLLNRPYMMSKIIDLHEETIKHNQELLDKYETKLMFALSPTDHELDSKTTNKFKEIIKKNIEEDTYTIKQKLKEYWKNRNDNNLFSKVERVDE